MNKLCYPILIIAAFLPVAQMEAAAEVNVNINFSPPPVVVAEPPAVVMVPHSQVYFVPDPHVDVFFYGGFWWSPRGEVWYRAKAYNGPWIVVDRYYVPAPIHHVPRDYRVIYERERHIPYGQWKKQMKRHEKEERREWKESRKEHEHGH